MLSSKPPEFCQGFFKATLSCVEVSSLPLYVAKGVLLPGLSLRIF